MTDRTKKELVDLCCGAIKIPSLSGQEQVIADYIEAAMMRFGFNTIERDRYGNISGQMIFGNSGNEAGRRVLFDGHMDHIDVTDRSKWTHDPFGAEIVDGKIYGRGTSDMKGNLMAALMAAKCLKENPEGMTGELIVCGVVHEECFEGVASELLGERWKPDCVIIGEASGLNIKRGQRGRAEVILETHGKSAHSSNPDVGLNAVKSMVKILAAIEQKFTPPEQKILGRGILEPTDIISSPYPGASVVPEGCRVTFDRRLLVGEDENSVLAPLNQIIESEMARDPSIHAEVSLATASARCYTGEMISAQRFAPGWLLPDQHWFISAAMDGLRRAGQTPELSHFAFCTNGSYYAGKAGIPTLGYGGSFEALAHVIDEYIEIEQLVKACEGYQAIIREVVRAAQALTCN